MIEGRAKSQHVKLINEFIDEHEAELYALWEMAQRGEYIEKIAR